MSTFIAKSIAPNSAEYSAIGRWQYAGSEFYTQQIPRLLSQDIPTRYQLERCLIYAFFDTETLGPSQPSTSRKPAPMVGFGTLQLSDEYSGYLEGRRHWYIPLLAVNPSVQGKGFGGAIVEWLVNRAACQTAVISRTTDAPAPFLVLDVYVKNERAIRLYQKCEFQNMNPQNPIPDDMEGNEEYFIMARRLPDVTFPPRVGSFQ